MTVKVHIEPNEKTFARKGIWPVSMNPRTWRPNNLFWITKLYRRSEDLTNREAATINQIVPGKPGKMYPIMPSVRQTKPTEIKISLLSRPIGLGRGG